MALPAATASAKLLIKKLLFHSPTVQLPPPKFPPLRCSISTTAKATNSTIRDKKEYKNEKKQKQKQKQKQKTELLVKRRTRSERELDVERYGNDNSAHVPVMLGEVLDVFASLPLKSFVDCTLGAGGHSAAVIPASLFHMF